MDSFGKKLRECREAKGLSQSDLARQLDTHHSIIGKYERDEVKPSIDVVKKIATLLGTTVGYLLGETEDLNMFKDPALLKRFNDINALTEKEKGCVYSLMDAFLAKSKLQSILK
jgi:transcriptional regulator with XRE-family HTH domain